MAVAAAVLSETQRSVLEAVCDTYVPSVESSSGDPIEREFLARSAGDMLVAAQIEGMFAETLLEEEIAEVAGLLDAVGEQGFLDADLAGRTALLLGLADADPDAKLGLTQLKALTMLLFYGAPDETTGRNANWEAIGYPGPVSARLPLTRRRRRSSWLGFRRAQTLSCDVVLVGSGAGGSVIAAECARAGKSVLVLEMGQYKNEQDFNQLEAQGYQELYYGGGLATSEDGSISVLAGQTLGGGTVVNYMNCIPTPERIVTEWAAHGLAELEDYEAYKRDHIDVVMERLNANTEATKQNGTHRADAGAGRDGPRAPADRPQRDAGRQRRELRLLRDGLPAGVQAVGDEDVAAGRVRRRRPAVVGCHAERILVADGRATGVECTVTNADGSTCALTVEAPAWWWPAARSSRRRCCCGRGIGGPAVGRT